ncbi:MAG: response regulator [bacterium]
MNANDLNILLVEDNPADVRLITEALKEKKIQNRLTVAEDGFEALSYLRREGGYENAPRPHLILLDLNLPKKNGHEVLEEIKTDENLRRIPVIILTTSTNEQDIRKSYDLHANCYINKPVDFTRWIRIVEGIENFWFTIVKIPME